MAQSIKDLVTWVAAAMARVWSLAWGTSTCGQEKKKKRIRRETEMGGGGSFKLERPCDAWTSSSQLLLSPPLCSVVQCLPAPCCGSLSLLLAPWAPLSWCWLPTWRWPPSPSVLESVIFLSMPKSALCLPPHPTPRPCPISGARSPFSV